MTIYSRLQRIKERKKRNLLYRKLVRVAVVPIVFVFAILLYFSMVSHKLEEVDQKEKAIKTEVAGEKTQMEKDEIFSPTVTSVPEKSPKPTQTSSGTIRHPASQTAPSPLPPTPTISQIVIPTPKPTADPLLIQLPE